MTPPDRRCDGGFTLVELSLAMVISFMVLGSVILVQSTAETGFGGTINEQRMTFATRTALAEMKREIRAALTTSIVDAPWTGQDGEALLAFQHAVGFDAQNGWTIWGGGNVPDGTVEYTVIGTDLVRRVRDDAANLVPSEQRTIIRSLDLNSPTGPPVTLEWDDDENVVRITLRLATQVAGQVMRRETATVLHVQNVFNF